MDRCVTLLLKRACPQPGRAPSRVYILLKRACSLPGRATSGVLPHWRTYKCAFSYRFPPAGHHAVRLHTSECKANTHSGAVYPRGALVRLHTSEPRVEMRILVSFPSSGTSVGLHTSTCDPGAHKYAKARYGAVYPRRTSRGRLTYRSTCRT